MKRVKGCSQINKFALSDKTAYDYQFKYVDIGNVNQNGIIQEPGLITFEEAPSRARRIVKENDVIISTVRTYLKAIAFFDFIPKDYIVSTGFAVLTHKSKVNPKFLAYHSQSECFIDSVIRNSTGVSYPAINSQAIAALHVIFPDFSEQTAIANYLDTKTAAIDRKIELLTAKADKYKALRRSLINETVCRGLPASERFTPSETLTKMKDSGIEWIGMIPEHWEEYRMKDLGFLYSGLSGKAGDDFNQDENENNCDFIPFTNIFNNDTINPDVMGKVVVFENEKQNKVKKNDLFFLMSSEDYDGLGKSSLLAVDLKNTYLNSFCKGFRITRKKVLPAFLNYQLQSDTFRKIMQIEGKGFTRLNLKMEKVNDFAVYIPNTIEEQIAIVEYLNERNAQIDTILTNISNQISKLTQLRKTLINDVVTGKIKVTD
ncbi:MAG: restriction endonuclease subunit S [Bacteroidia bacterium]|nr:restriction endonuclease subunit S [Bacteroidia bacterium]